MPATYYGAKDVAFFLASGRNILASQGNVTDDHEAVLAATTPLGVTWPVFTDTGGRKATLQQTGWFDAAAGGANEAICEREGTLQVICLGNEGNVRGRNMLAAAGAFAGKYARSMSAEGIHAANATYTVSGRAESPVILQALAAVTNDGNTEANSVNNGAATAAGGNAYLQVSAFAKDTATNLVVKVRHSEDNATFADLVTFTAVTAIGGECKAVTGDVYQYLATSRAWTGGAGAGSTATILVGFARA